MALSLRHFAKQTVDLGLLDETELSAIAGALPPEMRDDAQAAAKLLVERGKLTKYQASAVYQGRGKSLIFGDYVVLDRIGAGGMGQVFKARHRRMDRVVALKVIAAEALKNPDAVKRFEREVKAAAKLVHPNIVIAHDAGQQDGQHYLVMEYVEGSDLSTLLKRHHKLSVRQACDFVAQAARGLAFAHSKGVVHRDIKPSNLLVGGDGVVKVLDMGLARLDDGPAGAATKAEMELTQQGAVMGTVDYMAPEQAANTRHADAKSDVYSLGCTLYRLLTGDSPYHGETMVERILAHRSQTIPSLREKRPDVPPAVETLFTRMLAKYPDARPTMQEVADGLGPLAQSMSAGSSGIGLRGPDTAARAEPGSSTILRSASPTMVPTAAPMVAAGVASSSPRAAGLPVAPAPQMRSPSRAAAPRRRKSKLPLLLIAACGVILVGGGVWFAMQQRKDADPAADDDLAEQAVAPVANPPVTPPRAVPSATDNLFTLPPSPTAPSATVPNVVPTATAVATASPTSIVATTGLSASTDQSILTGAVDLLPLVQLPGDIRAGQWTRNGTTLTGTGKNSLVQIPYAPITDEYDLVLSGRRLARDQKTDGGISIGIVAEGHRFSIRVGRTSCGLSDGSTIGPPNFAGNLNLPIDDPCTIVCAVRKGSVRLDVNSQTALEYRGNFDAFRGPGDARPDQLFLGLDGDTTFEITSFKFVSPGAVKSTTGSPQAVAPTTTVPPPPTVTPPPALPVPPPVVFDATVERAVAQQILSRGGTVIVNVNGRQSPRINNLPLLPAEPFYIVNVGYVKHQSLVESDFTTLAKLGGLKSVEAPESSINDQGLSALASIKTLEYLNLNKARQLRGTTFYTLAQLPNLREVRINEIGLDDVSVQGLSTLKNLERLELSANVKLTNPAVVGGFLKLKYLALGKTGVRDFSPLGVLPELTYLGIGTSPLTDASLATIPHLPALAILNLSDTQITDAGLRYVERFATLTSLNVQNTFVTDAGASQWMAKHPSCRIVWKTRAGTPPSPGPLPPVPITPPAGALSTSTAPGSVSFSPASATSFAKRPVPAADAQRTALAGVKEVYSSEYAAAKQPDQKSKLSTTLLSVAKQTTEDVAARYVLLGEARALAIEAGDLNALRPVLISLTNDFETDETDLFVTTWNELCKRPRDPAVYRSLFDEANLLFDDAVTRARFDDAKRYGDFAVSMVGRLKDQALTKQTNERSTALVARRKEWETVSAAVEKLKTAPDDPEANLAVGRYLGVTADDWRRAFPLLAKGNDEVLKGLAEKSLAGAVDWKTQITLGDAWYDAAQGAKSPQKNELLAGMTFWYELAAPALTGLDRSRIDKRIGDAAPFLPQRKIPATNLVTGESDALTATATTAADDRPFMPVRGFGDPKPATAPPTVAPPTVVSPSVTGPVNLLGLIDLAKHVVHGPWNNVNGALVGGGVSFARIQIPYTPPPQYDITVTGRLVSGTSAGLNVGLVAGGKQSFVRIAPDEYGIGLRGLSNNEHLSKGHNFPLAEPFQFVCSVRSDSITTTLNGQKLLDYRGGFEQFGLGSGLAMPNKEQLFITASGDGKWAISSMILTPVSTP